MVEKAVGAFPGVRQAVVAADFYHSGSEKSLAAYVVGDVNAADLRKAFGTAVALFCVPDFIVPMVELPLSPEPQGGQKPCPRPLGRAEACCGRSPQGAVGETLAAIWKRLLGFEITDADVSFFSLGGTASWPCGLLPW